MEQVQAMRSQEVMQEFLRCRPCAPGLWLRGGASLTGRLGAQHCEGPVLPAVRHQAVQQPGELGAAGAACARARAHAHRRVELTQSGAAQCLGRCTDRYSDVSGSCCCCAPTPLRGSHA